MIQDNVICTMLTYNVKVQSLQSHLFILMQFHAHSIPKKLPCDWTWYNLNAVLTVLALMLTIESFIHIPCICQYSSSCFLSSSSSSVTRPNYTRILFRGFAFPHLAQVWESSISVFRRLVLGN